MNRTELQEQLIQQMLDDMDLKTMTMLCYDYLDESYAKYSDEELIENNTTTCLLFFPLPTTSAKMMQNGILILNMLMMLHTIGALNFLANVSTSMKFVGVSLLN
jgi:hypothetical protein